MAIVLMCIKKLFLFYLSKNRLNQFWIRNILSLISMALSMFLIALVVTFLPDIDSGRGRGSGWVRVLAALATGPAYVFTSSQSETVGLEGLLDDRNLPAEAGRCFFKLLGLKDKSLVVLSLGLVIVIVPFSDKRQDVSDINSCSH